MNRLMKLLSSTELLILQGLTLIYIDFENSFNKEQYVCKHLACNYEDCQIEQIQQENRKG